jgi:hypothetical protein
MAIARQIVVPDPDPTALTLELVRREVLLAQGLTDAQIGRVSAVFDAQCAALNNLVRETDRRYEDRFAAADLLSRHRFEALKESHTAAAVTAEKAVGAALAAAKEAVVSQNESNAASILKSEGGVSKQMDASYARAEAMEKTLNDKINSISSRLDRGDGSSRAKDASQSTILAISAIAISALAVIVSGISVLRAPAVPGVAAVSYQQRLPPLP